MRIERFNRPFKYSDLENYQQCPLSFYFKNTVSLNRKFVPWQLLMSKAVKLAINQIHQDETYFFQPEKLKDLLRQNYEDECLKLLKKGLAVKESEDIPFLSYAEMLEGYINKPDNNDAEILYSMKDFRFSIKPFTITYHFIGSLDQLRKNKDNTVELIVFKSGKKLGYRSFELFLNFQLSICAYALFQGEICNANNNWHKPVTILDYASIYFLQDHLPYRRNNKKRNPAGTVINIQTGKERGPALYRSTRRMERLQHIPRELGRICAAIKRNDFYPRPNFLCENHCNFQNYCKSAITFSIG